ncbi:hypothetical protein [Stenotrophomonas maltophilia]|uniref:hypothetical protein n=1 Tax=Stenotrophomonas maltophilia TaxID=40324 RepID=UPI0015DF9B6A|nr:hypothetical protein [Stenotrophomonas maltophilia]MBA0362362.1 hypothetical protein [Stenotrophomonas maltophilia]
MVNRFPGEQPRFDQPVVDQSGRVTQAWANYFLRLASAQSNDDLRALYEALAARVAALEDGEGGSFQILGQQSIAVNGIPQPGHVVIITLQGDTDSPGTTEYYGTGPTGAKGWFPVSDTITVNGGELTKTVGPDGVTTFGLADVPDSGAGTLLATTFDTKGRRTGSRPATITGTAQQIDVANGNAAAGLPTLSLAAEVLASLGKADSAVQEVRPGTNITVDNTDPRRPIVSAASGLPEAPNDGWPYARQSLSWAPLDGPNSPYVLLRWSQLTDQLGNPLTDQQGRPLLANSAQIPYQWLSGVPANLTGVAGLSGQGYAFRSSGGVWSLQTLASLQTLPAMTLAAANALTGVNDFQLVAITDLTGGREPCWYDSTVASGTKWRRFSDRSIAN